MHPLIEELNDALYLRLDTALGVIGSLLPAPADEVPGKAKAALRVLVRIPSAVERDAYARYVAGKLGLGIESLRADLYHLLRAKRRRQAA